MFNLIILWIKLYFNVRCIIMFEIIRKSLILLNIIEFNENIYKKCMIYSIKIILFQAFH